MTFGGFVDEFSNSPIQVAYPSNLTIQNSDFVANSGNVQLEWAGINPNTPYPFAQQIIVTSNALNTNKITLPNAMQASISQSVIFVNQTPLGTAPSSNSYVVCDYTGTPLFTVEANTTEADNLPNWYCFLSNNSTAAGTWVYYPQSGSAGSGGASAAVLVGGGYGLTAEIEPNTTDFPPDNIIVQNNTVTSISLPYAVSGVDRGHVLFSNGGAGTLTLPPVSTIGNGFTFTVINQGVGTINVIAAPGENVNGVSTNLTPYIISPTQTGTFVANGATHLPAGWYTTGFNAVPGTGTTIAVIPVATEEIQVLPSNFYSKDIQKFTDNPDGPTPLTAAFLYPQLLNTYFLWNYTTACTITVGVTNGQDEPTYINNQYTLLPGDILAVYTAYSDQETVAQTDMFPQNMTFLADVGSEAVPSYGFTPINSKEGKLTPSGTGFYATFANTTQPYASTVYLTSDSNKVFSFSHAYGNYSFTTLTSSNFLSGPQVTDPPTAAIVGNPATPNYSFSGVDGGTPVNLVNDTGMYLSAIGTLPANHGLGFSAGGVACIEMTSQGIEILVPFVLNDPLLEIAGTASNPSYSFQGNDTSSQRLSDTGMWLQSGTQAAHVLGLAAQGTNYWQVGAPSSQIAGNPRSSMLTNGPLDVNFGGPGTTSCITRGDTILGNITGSSIRCLPNSGTFSVADENGDAGTTVNLISGSNLSSSSTVNILTGSTLAGTSTVNILTGNTFTNPPVFNLLTQNASPNSIINAMTFGGTFNIGAGHAAGDTFVNIGLKGGAGLGELNVYGPISAGGVIGGTATYEFLDATGDTVKASILYTDSTTNLSTIIGATTVISSTPTSVAILGAGTGNSVNVFTNTGAAGAFTIGATGTTTSSLTLNGNLTVSGSIDFTGPLLLGNGSAAAPTYSFDNSTNTGMYLSGVGILGLAAAGVGVLTMGNNYVSVTNGVQFIVPNGSTAAPSYGFSQNTAVGMYLKSDTGPLAFSYTTDILTLSNTAAVFTPPVSVPINNGTAGTPGLYFAGTTNTGFGVVGGEENIIIWYSGGTQLCNGGGGQFQFDVPVTLLSVGSLTTPAINFNYQPGQDNSRTGLYLKQNQSVGTGSQVSISCAAGATAATGVDAAVFSPNGIESLIKPLTLANGGVAVSTTVGSFWPTAGQVLTSVNATTAPIWQAPASVLNIQATTVETDLILDDDETSYVIVPGMTVTITPTTTTSKILVQVNSLFSVGNPSIINIRISRSLDGGSTWAVLPGANYNATGHTWIIQGSATAEDVGQTFCLDVLDTPGQATPVQYALFWRYQTFNPTANQAQFNATADADTTACSSIVAMQVSV